MMKAQSVSRVVLGMWVAFAGAAVSACDVNLKDGNFDINVTSGKAADEWSKSYPMAAGGTLEIINVNGTMEFVAGSGSAVEVKAERRARASSDDAAKALLQDLVMVETVEAGRVRIEAKYPKTSGMRRLDVKFLVAVPKGVRVEARNQNGRIQLTGLDAAARASTVNGGVRGEGLTGAVQASCTNGGIELGMDGLAADGLEARAVNGRVSVTLPKTAKAVIDASAVNGGIGTEGLEVTERTRSRNRLDATLNGGGPKVALSVVNGGVRLVGK